MYLQPLHLDFFFSCLNSTKNPLSDQNYHSLLTRSTRVSKYPDFYASVISNMLEHLTLTRYKASVDQISVYLDQPAAGYLPV
jgi:hypothetical protein